MIIKAEEEAAEIEEEHARIEEELLMQCRIDTEQEVAYLWPISRWPRF